jgi:hypothetical protein
MANPLPKKQNPYDGKVKSITKNGLGQDIYTDNEYKYCRDINKGVCPFYE